MAALLEVEGDIQRVDIRVVCVVDQHAIVDALLHVQAHGDRLQPGKFIGIIYAGRLQIKHYCQAMDHIFNGSIIGERNDVFLSQPEQCAKDDCFFLFLFDLFDIKRCIRVCPAPGNRLM